MDKLNMIDFATKVCMGPPKLLPVHCRICGRRIGDTTNVLHTLDLCILCKEHWKAEMRKERLRLAERFALNAVEDAMAKERRT